ncbi:hypothetical protein CORC01_13343 [Colletotrichum orchidophilum]|uniref:Nucleoside 2-deoxyribosyltransferase n=1 Tax=Colletotrichum orchidophilum TaxID=1209926 RepID=A0A1G4AQI5_9PEZI|nr:uncharacterized protein CORC01_13343 [Colletotrichum orchidophilum]OHE91366.1 hypothetical protein CORC01_13343 [Colletotrichum orchidophilum]
MSTTPPNNNRVLRPLTRPPTMDEKSVFLAGTTSKRDWRKDLSGSLSHLPVIIFDPFRPDWDSTWKEDIADERFRSQTEWELEMQERADIIVVYFEPDTEGHISLLELGLCARSGKVIVACPDGYKKRGNVQVVCSKYGIPLVESYEALYVKLVQRLKEI